MAIDEEFEVELEDGTGSWLYGDGAVVLWYGGYYLGGICITDKAITTIATVDKLVAQAEDVNG